MWLSLTTEMLTGATRAEALHVLAWLIFASSDQPQEEHALGSIASSAWTLE